MGMSKSFLWCFKKKQDLDWPHQRVVGATPALLHPQNWAAILEVFDDGPTCLRGHVAAKKCSCGWHKGLGESIDKTPIGLYLSPITRWIIQLGIVPHRFDEVGKLWHIIQWLHVIRRVHADMCRASRGLPPTGSPISKSSTKAAANAALIPWRHVATEFFKVSISNYIDKIFMDSHTSWVAKLVWFLIY